MICNLNFPTLAFFLSHSPPSLPLMFSYIRFLPIIEGHTKKRIPLLSIALVGSWKSLVSEDKRRVFHHHLFLQFNFLYVTNDIIPAYQNEQFNKLVIYSLIPFRKKNIVNSWMFVHFCFAKDLDTCLLILGRIWTADRPVKHQWFCDIHCLPLP